MALIFGLIALVVLYYVIRTAVRDGILDAWKRRESADRPAADQDLEG
jgi:hypothetical protein